MSKCKIYLVPGFFGFTSLGALNYFHRVGEVLEEALERHGIDADIHECATQPTGSIRKRADRVLEQVIATGGLDADKIHLIGHSTGGLDIRLVATPGVKLREDDSEDRLGEKLGSVISVATPHFGTPLANFFTTLQGKHLLQILTLLATSSPGRYGIFAGAQLMQRVARADNFIGRDRTMLDNLSESILERISVDREDPIFVFLREVSEDQGAIIQLTPEGMHLFNAAVIERPDVSYRCVVTAAPPPFAHKWNELLNPTRAAMAGIFALLHKLTSREHIHYPYPSPAHFLAEEVQGMLPFELTPETNDGVVPTLSQLHGTPVEAVVADHLDIVGQFRNNAGDPLSDWLPSGSRYNEERFRANWDRIADAIALAN